MKPYLVAVKVGGGGMRAKQQIFLVCLGQTEWRSSDTGGDWLVEGVEE